MNHSVADQTATVGTSQPRNSLGYVLPGTFFIVWSTWWIFSIVRLYFEASSEKRYKSRTWFELPKWGAKYPIEPYLKVILAFVGINVELWAGHISYRVLYNPLTGGFMEGNLQDWQESAMYAGFMASGIVDLIGFYAPPGTLPPGVEQAFLGIAFVNEGLLYGFRLKGTLLDMIVHGLLALIIFASSICILMEISHPHSLLLSIARAELVLLQGFWSWQVAEILTQGSTVWDPTTYGAVAMVPFAFVVWVLSTAMGTVLVFTAINVYRLQKIMYGSLSQGEEGDGLPNGEGTQVVLELPSTSHFS